MEYHLKRILKAQILELIKSEKVDHGMIQAGKFVQPIEKHYHLLLHVCIGLAFDVSFQLNEKCLTKPFKSTASLGFAKVGKKKVLLFG